MLVAADAKRRSETPMAAQISSGRPVVLFAEHETEGAQGMDELEKLSFGPASITQTLIRVGDRRYQHAAAEPAR